ncbi:hypothetical protein Cgig2_019579 [Carnegiea gigantea]|uniref:Uncharacterized protein n=1 Tax=Carnegiea gigantea TaxID=171969 RepID=A0A9Q1KJ15_9CARY|nr:hypothetical protein Cgig2_019579 [Carnegiea gigantea]
MSPSKLDRQEMVSRCRARKRYIKQLVQARLDLSLAHSFYFRSLSSTGAALLQFAAGESSLHLHRNPFPSLPPLPLPTPPPLSSVSSSTWTSTTTSSAVAPPPPASTWDFWDPFATSSAGAQFEAEEEEWEETTSVSTIATPTVVRAAAGVAASPSVVMVARKGKRKELVEIIKELDEYFVKAADDDQFTCMWRSMYECHQVQMHRVDQLKFINSVPSTEPISTIHRQSTLQLESQLQRWQQSLCDLVKTQRDYISSLTECLHLSLFEFNKNPLMRPIQDSFIYSLCEEWQLAIDRVPDKVASEGIKNLLNVIHAIVIQQAEEQEQEHKHKKRLEAANKELEKRAAWLRSLEVKYGPYSILESGSRNNKGRVEEKRMKVEMLKARADEENWRRRSMPKQ